MEPSSTETSAAPSCKHACSTHDTRMEEQQSRIDKANTYTFFVATSQNCGCQYSDKKQQTANRRMFSGVAHSLLERFPKQTSKSKEILNTYKRSIFDQPYTLRNSAHASRVYNTLYSRCARGVLVSMHPCMHGQGLRACMHACKLNGSTVVYMHRSCMQCHACLAIEKN